jgi:ferredoxin
MAIFPGLAISVAVFAFNLFGDSLRKALGPSFAGAMSARVSVKRPECLTVPSRRVNNAWSDQTHYKDREAPMPYVIAEPCISVKDKACVEVCPVDCIYEGKDQLFIHPDECIDCGACEPVCPVKAIFAEDETPDQWKSFIELNKQFFKDNPGVKPATKS